MNNQDANVTGFEQLPAVLTSREAARALRMGLKELRQLIERGELPAARLGPRRVIRIAKAAIVSLLGGTPPADAAPPSDVKVAPVQTGAPLERPYMPARLDPRNGTWRYRVQIRLPDGSTKRIEGTPNINTKEAAVRAEKEHIFREEEAIRNPKRTEECPTFEKFAPEFLKICGAINKPSEVETKEMILRCHLVPAFGLKLLDADRVRRDPGLRLGQGRRRGYRRRRSTTT